VKSIIYAHIVSIIVIVWKRAARSNILARRNSFAPAIKNLMAAGNKS